MARLRASWAGLFALAVCTGCTAGSSLNTATPTPHAASSLSEVGSSEDWQTLAQGDVTQDPIPSGLANQSYAVLISGTPNATSLRVRDRRTDSAVLQRHTRPGWQLAGAWLDSDVLVFAEMQEPRGHRQGRTRITAYDLVEHRQLPVRHHPRTTGPDVAVDNAQIAFASGRPESGMCVEVHSLSNGSAGLRRCFAQGLVAADLDLQGQRLAVSLLSGGFGENHRCKTLRYFDTVSGRALPELDRRIRATSGCLAWQGTSSGAAAVWTQVDPYLDRAHATTYAVDHDQLLTLGPSATGNFISCAGSYYFEGDRVGQLLRWEPGMTLPEAELQLEEGAFFSDLRCNDSWLSMFTAGLGPDQTGFAVVTRDVAVSPVS